MKATIKHADDGYYWASVDDDDWMGPFTTYQDAKIDAEMYGFSVGRDNYPW